MDQICKRLRPKSLIVLAACSILTLLAPGATGWADGEAQHKAVTSSPSTAKSLAASSEIAVIECPTGGYVLCIAATCFGDGVGTCGVYSKAAGAQKAGSPCDQTGIDSGTCGACWLFTSDDNSPGHLYFVKQSVQYIDPLRFGDVYTSCDDLDSHVSTFSVNLLENFKFEEQNLKGCPATPATANCMGARCNPTRLELSIPGTTDGTLYPTYTCECLINGTPTEGEYQNQNPPAVSTEQPYCEASWSVG